MCTDYRLCGIYQYVAYIIYVTNPLGIKAVHVSSDNKMHNDNPIDKRAQLKVDSHTYFE